MNYIEEIRNFVPGCEQEEKDRALMLAVIAILPIILGAVANMNISMGGTSIIIVVGVALDTARSLESQMMMRHYKGFLE